MKIGNFSRGSDVPEMTLSFLWLVLGLGLSEQVGKGLQDKILDKGIWRQNEDRDTLELTFLRALILMIQLLHHVARLMFFTEAHRSIRNRHFSHVPCPFSKSPNLSCPADPLLNFLVSRRQLRQAWSAVRNQTRPLDSSSFNILESFLLKGSIC
jgi:hypothetical protein